LGRDPARRIICASYAQDLSVKLANDCRAVMNSDWYRATFPTARLDRQKNTEGEVMTTARGFRLATSVGGTLTGRGGNLLIIDDPIKPQDALSEASRSNVVRWFDNTAFSRLDDKQRDAIVIVMQRVHVEDLAGILLDKGGWKHLNLPAIAEQAEEIDIGGNTTYSRAVGELLHEAREPHSVLNEIKATIGTYDFSAQYQQQPLPPDGGLIKWSWFKTFDTLPASLTSHQIVQSWDTASKAEEIHDYSVCTTWLADRSCYLLIDVHRARLEYPDLKRCVVEQAARHQADSILIEDKGSGTQLIQDLRQGHRIHPIPITPQGDKITRMHTQSAKIESGQVLLPNQAYWLDEFRREMQLFPNGRHDDQVDSVSQFLNWISNRSEPNIRSL